MDFLGAVYRAVRTTVNFFFPSKKNHLTISSWPVIKDFDCCHGNPSLTHQLHLNHIQEDKLYMNWIELNSLMCAQHIVSFRPLRSHDRIWRGENIIGNPTIGVWDYLITTQPSHCGPQGKQGSLLDTCSCCLPSSPSPLYVCTTFFTLESGWRWLHLAPP